MNKTDRSIKKNDIKGEKVEIIKFDSPFFSSYVFYENKKLSFEELVGKTLSQNHIKYLDTSFELYFKKLLTINSHQDFNNELINFKTGIKNYFVFYIASQIWTNKTFATNMKLDNKEVKEKLIQKDLLRYVSDIFFFAGITFYVLNNNIEEIKSITENSLHDSVESINTLRLENIFLKSNMNKVSGKNLGNKNKPGRPGKFKTQIELHQEIFKIFDWQHLSNNALAKKLGYKSSSGLNELIKTKKWSLPKK